MRVFVVGSLNMDLVVKADKYPALGETITGHTFMTNPGGKGANQAVACSKFKCDTHMVGAVGDTFGDELVTALNDYEVKTTHVNKISNISSGVAVITIAENDNVIVLDMGANQFVTRELVDSALNDAHKKDVLLVQNEISTDTIFYTLKKAKNLEMVTIYNPAPAKQINIDMLKYVDYLILNQSEALYYTGLDPQTFEQAKEACSMLKKYGAQHLILTLGKHGSLYYGEHVIKVPAFPVNIVDTTAAGDTFIGGFVSSLIHGKSIEPSLRFAAAAASLTISKEGAQKSIPSYEEVLDFMSKHTI